MIDIAKSADAALRLIAFYLPQFHPIPENNAWWGQGFTEWRNVVDGKALFPGHYQPHLPSDLGFYDLRVQETRIEQAELASQYGIGGFCYYHYWFNGRRLLERPFEEVMSSGQPQFPFCLCWANETWTRAWDGQSGLPLIQQTYSPDDDQAHIRWLGRVFEDPRYIRVDGKPLFLVYRAAALPDPRETTHTWRGEMVKAGIGEIYLCRVESNFEDERGDPAKIGFDAAVEFQPDVFRLGTPMRRGKLWAYMSRLGLSAPVYSENSIFPYKQVIENMLNSKRLSYRRFPCVTPMWDNSARRKKHAFILTGSTPELYEQWLRSVVKSESQIASASLVFINAWNEWAEGCHLEPDQRFERAYLEATKRALT